MADASRFSAGTVDIRRATEADEPAILELARHALGWAGDERDRAFFRWKHRENPFGESPMWLAEDAGRVVGFRTFLRWEFVDAGGSRFRAVRAVDTATHPDAQGRGVFTALTLRALDELRDEGVDFVFNTPNRQSLPGYLKMGWQEVGRLPVAVRPRSPIVLPKLVAARVAAEKWSEPLDVGEPAADAWPRLMPRLDVLAPRRGAGGLSTPRSAEYLRWRYGFPSLAYRVLTDGRDPVEAILVFRVRRRGAARELVVCELLTSDAPGRGGRRLARAAIRVTRADYLIGLRGTLPRRTAFPLPGQGPVLTYRNVTRTAGPPEFALGLGDVELF